MTKRKIYHVTSAVCVATFRTTAQSVTGNVKISRKEKMDYLLAKCIDCESERLWGLDSTEEDE